MIAFSGGSACASVDDEGDGYVTSISGTMRDAAGVDVASINGYVLLRGRGQHAVLADAADDADGELVNAVTALFSRSAGHLDASHLKSGAWHGYRMSGGTCSTFRKSWLSPHTGGHVSVSC